MMIEGFLADCELHVIHLPRALQIALLGAFAAGGAHWVGWRLAAFLLPDFVVIRV